MAYGYWKSKKADKRSVFHMYYRKAPYKGEYAVFSGLDRALKMIKDLKFTDQDIDRLKAHYGDTFDLEFYDYLQLLDFSRITVRSVQHGEICPPNIPLMVIDGPVIMGQLLETGLLSLVSFPTSIATYANRIVRTVKNSKKKISFLEFGLRRAQGPDGAMTASKYAILGGFDGTSNFLSGSINGSMISGTMAHAFVMMCDDLNEVYGDEITATGKTISEFKQLVLEQREKFGFTETNDGELGAFIQYACALPRAFLALLDTYNTLESGVLNYMCVASVLANLGFKPIGVRLDSGDLGYLSKKIRQKFVDTDNILESDIFTTNKIVASNEIDDDVLLGLERDGHEIDVFGIGTKLATCSKSPSLGMVYKVVWFNGKSKIKFSEDPDKSTLPADKQVYRLYGENNIVILDLMSEKNDANELFDEDGTIFCRHPSKPNLYAKVHPTKVESLLRTVFLDGNILVHDMSVNSAKRTCAERIETIRPDHLRHLNPTPLKVSVDRDLYNLIQEITIQKMPRKVLH